MVRNNPTENPWEVNTVRPAFAELNPEICLKITSVRQEDIAVKRQAMIAAGEPLHVWSPNWGGDGFQSDRVRGLLQDLTPLIEQDNFDTSVVYSRSAQDLPAGGQDLGAAVPDDRLVYLLQQEDLRRGRR